MRHKGFTLIELLVVIAIIGILAVVVTLIINPAETTARARDTQRLSDLDNLKSAINTDLADAMANGFLKSDVLCQSPAPTPCYGTSIDPGTSTRNSNGTGWVTVDLSGGKVSSFPVLPVDPSNPTNGGTSDYHYVYYSNGKDWEIATKLEAKSNQHLLMPNGLYAVGSSLNLIDPAHYLSLVGGSGGGPSPSPSPSGSGGPSSSPSPSPSSTGIVQWSDTFMGNDVESNFPWNPLSTCGTSHGLYGYEPASPGKYPVLIFLPGTWANYKSSGVDQILQEAARMGFVAVSVDYATGIADPVCPVSNEYKGQCIFNPGSTQSAVSKVCSRAKADCTNQGIAVAGHSQGAAIGYSANNHDPRVKAVWAIDYGADSSSWGWNFCSADPSLGSGRTISSSNIRLIFGAADSLTPVSSANAVFNKSCTGGNCLNPDGSGWYQVQSNEVSTGSDDGHCIFSLYGCTDTLDPNFAPPSKTPWSLDTNLEWLKSKM